MRGMTMVVAVVAVLALAACGDDAPAPAKEIGFIGDPYLAADVELVNAALKAFTAACPGLFAYPDDIAEAQVSYVDPALSYAGENFGWTKALELRVKVVDRPRKLPIMAGGHNLWYRLGAGKSPGITSSKEVSGDICGFPVVQSGYDRFVPRSEFNMLANLKAG